MNGDDRELRREGALPGLSRLPGVLAVLVVYRRTLAQLEPWQALRQAMEGVPAGGTLQVRQVLIYDNSPSRMVESDSLPEGVRYYHDPTNGGTARAYAKATALAASESVEWVLLLDQDTRLPPDFFATAGTALSQTLGRLPGALLPKVAHGAAVISPSLLTPWGSTRPLASSKGYVASGLITGISSGAFVRTDALKAVGEFPSDLWLDYVDHWLFSRLRARGEQILPFSAVVQHDLSIARPHCVDTNRFRSILDGEAIFVATLPAFARRMYRLRLFMRAVRLASTAPRHSAEILSRIFPWPFRARQHGRQR